MIQLKKNALYLVTGGSGFLGVPLVSRLIDSGVRVRVLSRSEGKLVELKQKHPSVEILTGDVSDPFEVKQAMNGVSGVFHLAASKHVGIAEDQVRECLKTNTIGSLNILEESLNNNLDFVVGVSTDKAAQVSGVYGATKLLMERLFGQFSKLDNKCKYRIVRYGNVLYSTGSVLCKWKELIIKNKPLIITDPEATRFFWTVDQALDLIFECLQNAQDSSPYVPEMRSMSMGNILDAMVIKYNPRYDGSQVKIIGLQAGENKHEKILEDGLSSAESEQYSVKDIMKLI